MPQTPQLRGLNLVLIGDFNPTIFHPRWFAAEGLLTEEESRTANIQVVHPDVTTFQLEWVQLMVQRDRFQVSCQAQPYFERVAALTSQTFDVLRHTPLRMLGINNDAHYRASSLDKWHELGHKLAPKELWREFFPDPGMQTLTIRQLPRPDGERGYVQVTIEPSGFISPGVFMSVNDHFELGAQDLGATAINDLLKEKWANAIAFAERVFSRLAEQA